MILMHRKVSGDVISENTLIKKYLGWEPSIPLKKGMKKTYDWIKEQMLRMRQVEKRNKSIQ